MRFYPQIIFPFLSIPFIFFTGCGPGKGDVSGKVSFQGKNLKYGGVLFYGSDGIPAAGVIQRDGTYSVSKVATGEAFITVTSVDPKKNVPPFRPEAKKEDAKNSLDPEDVKNWFPIPADYSIKEKAGLKFNVRSGSNTHNIELK